MAPPGFGPPGSSIPPRYRQREPSPDGSDTNTRPCIIFLGYLTTCIFVAALVVSRAARSYNALTIRQTVSPLVRKKVWLFGLLAAGGLMTTWIHMFRYFGNSYQNWLMWRSYYDLEPHQRHWGLWLRETSLYKEFWETVIVGNARYWWSHQIFFFALALGLTLEQQGEHLTASNLPITDRTGVRRGIKHTWAFMFLGQAVAVSFATNLLFITLLSNGSESLEAKIRSSHRKWAGAWLFNFIAILSTTYTVMLLAGEHYWHHPTAFLPVLLAPHVSLSLLPLARVFLPANMLQQDEHLLNKAYSYMWVLVLCNAGLMLVWTTASAYSYAGFHGIQHALHEHPAVSSVAYDVIFCWISWICWMYNDNSATKSESQELGSLVKRE